MESAHFRQRFIAAEAQFLTAFAVGQQGLSGFVETWTTLFTDFTTASKLQQVDADTSNLVHIIASRIAILADHLMSLDAEADSVCRLFQSDLDNIQKQDAGVSGPSDPPFPDPSSHLLGSHAADDKLDTTVSLDVVAHHWLVQNLHDPYPPTPVKTSIAEACGCSTKDVQEWFAHARRLIGWTTLCQERFGGSRVAATEAACHAYTDAGDNNLSSDIIRAFATIKANALHFRLDPSNSSDNHLITPVRGSESPCLHPSVVGFHAQTSSSALPEDEDEGEEDTTPPPPIAGCKRRLDTSIMPESSSVFNVGGRPAKRHRFAQNAPTTSLNSRLAVVQPMASDFPSFSDLSPSPKVDPPISLKTAAGVSCLSHAKPMWTVPPCGSIALDEVIAQKGASVTPHSPTRKRRLSDAATIESPKRPRGLAQGPRKQTVSDPLPDNHSFDSLGDFGADRLSLCSFDMPTAGELSSLSFDIELASLCALPDLHMPPMPSSEPVSPAPQMDVSDADLASISVDGFDLSTFASSDAGTATAPQTASIQMPLNNSDVSPSPSVGSWADLSDCGLVDSVSYEDWCRWEQSLGSFQPSLSSCHPPRSHYSTSPLTSDDLFHCPDDTAGTTFDVNPSFTSSDLLAAIGGLPLTSWEVVC